MRHGCRRMDSCWPFTHLYLSFGYRAFLSLAATALLLSCTEAPSDTSPAGLGAAAVTDRDSESRDITIRVMPNLYYPGSLPPGAEEPLHQFADVVREWEELHPGVEVELVVKPTSANDGEWLLPMMIGGIAPEIVELNTEVAWEHADKGWFINLEPFLEEPNPYVSGNERWWDVFANIPLTKAKRAPDGNLYCVVFDLVETGIFMNRDILRSAGVTEWPRTFAEFLDVQKRVKEQGYVPLVWNLDQAGDWGQDIVFDMIYASVLEQLNVLPEDEGSQDYYQGYLSPKEICYLVKNGYFGPHDPRYREVWRILREWRPYWTFDLLVEDTNALFVTQMAAMKWDGSWLAPRLLNDPMIDFGWEIEYLPPITAETSPFAVGSQASVIGGAAMQYHITSRALAEDNLDLCIDFMHFLTTPANAERIINENGAFIPNIRGAKTLPALEAFGQIIQRHYCAVKWMYTLDSEFNATHKRWYHYYLEGGMDLDEFLELEWVYLNEAVDRWLIKQPVDFSEWPPVPPPDQIQPRSVDAEAPS